MKGEKTSGKCCMLFKQVDPQVGNELRQQKHTGCELMVNQASETATWVIYIQCKSCLERADIRVSATMRQ